MKKRKITDNIPLKIMSVAIAVVLWLIVVNIDNPTGTNYYTLNDVELINKEYVESSDVHRRRRAHCPLLYPLRPSIPEATHESPRRAFE